MVFELMITSNSSKMHSVWIYIFEWCATKICILFCCLTSCSISNIIFFCYSLRSDILNPSSSLSLLLWHKVIYILIALVNILFNESFMSIYEHVWQHKIILKIVDIRCKHHVTHFLFAWRTPTANIV